MNDVLRQVALLGDRVKALESASTTPGHGHVEQLVKDASTTLARAQELEQRFTELYRALQQNPITLWGKLEALESELRKSNQTIAELRELVDAGPRSVTEPSIVVGEG